MALSETMVLSRTSEDGTDILIGAGTAEQMDQLHIKTALARVKVRMLEWIARRRMAVNMYGPLSEEMKASWEKELHPLSVEWLKAEHARYKLERLAA